MHLYWLQFNCLFAYRHIPKSRICLQYLHHEFFLYISPTLHNQSALWATSLLALIYRYGYRFFFLLFGPPTFAQSSLSHAQHGPPAPPQHPQIASHTGWCLYNCDSNSLGACDTYFLYVSLVLAPPLTPGWTLDYFCYLSHHYHYCNEWMTLTSTTYHY